MKNDLSFSFPFEEIDDGRWLVHLDRQDVKVHTREHAEAMATLPILHSKIMSRVAGQSDVLRAQRVVKVYDDYHLTMPAVRQVAAWLRQQK